MAAVFPTVRWHLGIDVWRFWTNGALFFQITAAGHTFAGHKAAGPASAGGSVEIGARL